MQHGNQYLRYVWIAVAGLAVLNGCSSPSADRINLMPAPDVYGDGLLNLLPDTMPFEGQSHGGILFATDRRPSQPGDKEPYYRSDPGFALRVGLAGIQFGSTDFTWEMARDVSLLKSRAGHFPVKVVNVEEWGAIQNTLPFWLNLEVVMDEERPEDATRDFAEAINRRLAASGKKHVYIYVHGYRVAFENPVLVSAELWHFLGYNGAFIAYSWPSTPSKYAYIKDSDTAVGFARNLRLLLEFLAEETHVEKIHIIGYSNGTRLVLRALEQLALMNADHPADYALERVPLGQVILVGSDLDRSTFGSYLADGLLDVVQHMTIYISASDKALGLARFLTRRERLGEMWGTGGREMEPSGRQALQDLMDKLSFISVNEAEGSTEGKGHGYFRSSPWVSSDVLMTLYYDFIPEQRGLILQEDLPIYCFPADYISRLWDAIKEEDAAFAERYERLRQAAE
jgi:esterase/lipase superfamily enzyme